MNTYSYNGAVMPPETDMPPTRLPVDILRRGNLPAEDARHLGEIFAALADPTRLRLLDALARAEELRVSDLCALLDLNQSNVSHQLRLLRAHRLVRNRREGRNVFYALDDDHVRSLLCEGLQHVREPNRGSGGSTGESEIE